MDQETGWIAGILEAEGCVERDRLGRCRISISNTNNQIINCIASFYDKNLIDYKIYKVLYKNIKYKDLYNIRVHGLNNCYNLIKLLGESFQCRKIEFLKELQTGICDTK